MKYTLLGVPVEELELGDVFCLMCGIEISGEAFYADEFDGHFCDSRIKEYLNEIEQESEASALANCRITEDLPMFDAENQFSCSPEEYELGMRTSNTPNSHLAGCRHQYTNYDGRIRPFDRFSDLIADQICYAAILKRRDAMLIAEIERIQPDDAHEFYVFESFPG